MKKILFFLLLFPAIVFSQETIDLSGVWRFAIDRNDVGITQKWYAQSLEDHIKLPGSMLQNRKGNSVTAQTQWTGSLFDSTYYYSPAMEKYRQPGNIKFPFFLTPDFHYTGAAWYQTTVTVPENWKGKTVQLFLERPHIETTVWVDSMQAGDAQYSLCVPHLYDLTSFLQAGQSHTISVRVDNTIKKQYNPGIDSHSITDQTQGNWNGIAGKINLTAIPPVHIEAIQVYPNVDEKTARVAITVENTTAQSVAAKITLSAESFNSEQQRRIPGISSAFVSKKGKTTLDMTLNMGEEMLTWDEFEPALYKLKATVSYENQISSKEVQFGMREIKIDGKWFYINGRKIMLRGTVENCNFPLTGYAPMDVDSWLKVFKICRNHGLNHVRFHSFCPPEAAFIAADITGIYLQPEGPSWPNHGVALGRGMAIDTFLLQETQAMNRFYGNYASFCMLACGNEPAGDWVPWVSRFVEYWEKNDSRKVYTGASVGGSWAWQPRSQYHVKAGARGLTWNTHPETVSDYRNRIDTVKQPYISHETGQWCAFPNFAEIKKYTGVYKAHNFEIFRDLLEENNMGTLAYDFHLASGKLQALCYKHEIEKTLRTPDYAGFQLLALNDYSGQGSALVGILDVFWEEKPYIRADQFRRFCNETVPLTRMNKFIFKNTESFNAQVEVYHFGQKPLKQALLEWKITGDKGVIVDKGAFVPTDIPIGNCFEIGIISASLEKITKACCLNLEVKIAGTSFINDWDFWVYPEIVLPDKGNVLITDTLDDEAIRTLEQGGNVLILAAGKIRYGKEIRQQLTPVFWNTSWFKMRPPHTTGLLINSHHPVFNDFPTQYHSNLQWADLVHNAQVMLFTEFPEEFQPLVQNIHTWFISKKTGSLFEAKTGKGKLVMTSLDLQTDLEKRLVARQLLSGILDYMNSSEFQPESTVAIERIADLFTKNSETKTYFTKDAPDEIAERQMERLDRGLVAVKTTDGVFLSWRLLGYENPKVTFNIYRNGTLLNDKPVAGATNWTDRNGTVSDEYEVKAINDRSGAETSAKVKPWEHPYKIIQMNRPEATGEIAYLPNDCSAGDLDGDGEYEIIVKWNARSHDNSHDGITDNVFLDAYKTDGTQLWRIDLGKNIRAGAHYTQFMVYDLDGDGIAEIACKTAPGTRDGKGKRILLGNDDPQADYRNNKGHILNGPEYLTVFNGTTGGEITTIPYNPPRGSDLKRTWGDDEGNRSDRYLACIAYLDGIHPSLVMCRGYYTRAVLVAYDLRDGKLNERWVYDSGIKRDIKNTAFGQGNHSLAVGDVDGDGFDEIIYGGAAIDHDGTLLYSTGLGHGDAHHLSDLDPDRPGLEFFDVHETKPSPAGVELRDAASGELLFGHPTAIDVGRGLAADIDPLHRGFEFWSIASDNVYNIKGEVISTNRPSVNFRIYWDGDLQDELLNGTKITKWKGNGSALLVDFKTDGASSINGTKQNPNLSADLFGDWREEVIYYNRKNPSQLLIFTTVIPTEHRLTTLMHDFIYRLSIAWQNVAYNQPPHLGFYIGD